MNPISGGPASTGSNPIPAATFNKDRNAWLENQARIDAQYDLAEAKRFETLSRFEIKSSADPSAQFSRMKLSDNERSILAEIAKLNGWSRQAAEAMYKMSVAMDKGLNSIGEYLKTLTGIEPGYFDANGAHTLGLTEADRRRILGLPEDLESLAPNETGAPDPRDAENNTPTVVSSAANATNKTLTDEELADLSKAAQSVSGGTASVVALYKVYLATSHALSITDFLQLIAHKHAADVYGKRGGVQNSPTDAVENKLLNLKI